MSSTVLLPVWVGLLAVVQPSDSQATPTRPTLTACYCNNGSTCFNNTCRGYRQDNVWQPIKYCSAMLTKENKLLQNCLYQFSGCIERTCCNTDFCNKCPDWKELGTLDRVQHATFPPECNITLPDITEQEVTSATPSSSRPWWPIVVIVLVILVVILLPLSLMVICYVIWARRKQISSDVESVGVYDDPYNSGGSSRFQNTRPLKVKTFAHKIQLKKNIGKGGSGQVWLGDYEGRPVAVKVLKTIHRKMWERETEIYRTDMLSHPNILTFITNEIYDNKDIDIDLWLIFEYHPRGSLYSYLGNHTLSPATCLSYLLSITDGLDYLHSFIATGTNYQKQIIAHRDLKTSNILVVNDSSCCISDFGLAVMESDFRKEEVPDHAVGTKRYLAPEILDGTIQKERLHSYVMADVYSLALVMWEVARRCNWRGNDHEVPPYEVPYESIVPHNPGLDDMRKIVAEEGYRPPLDVSWKNNEILSRVYSLIHDTWKADPCARINSTKVKLELRSLVPK